MNTYRPFKRIVAASLGAALLSAGANALADPPSRIARLAFISGPVSLAPAGENSWEFASLNRPLIAGDRLWLEPGARDELQVGGAALRMDGNTLVTLLNMDDRVTQLQLTQGRLNVRVRKLAPNDVFEIDTPNLALSIRQPGDYRIEVDPAGNATMVAVRRGQAEAYGEGNAYRLGSGQAYRFAGTDLRDVQNARPSLDDEFDRWSASRDRRIEQARSVRYVSPDMIGYEDLDEQGSWRTVPSYGNVWMPAHVGRDWAPYRDGHWAYVQPWGWTWVDDAPWGFAVSHYGRWARFPDGWGWVPGPRAASPVYAPALVAFISIGTGAYAQRERPVAWFPLAPREVYRPSYRASTTYITNINITNTTLNRSQVGRDDRHAIYANRQVGGAVTAVPASAFVRAQPVSRAALAVPVAALAGAAIAHTAPVAPERDGMRGRGNPGHQPPQALMARQVLAKNAPPPAFRQAPQPAGHGAPAPANVAGQAAPQFAGPAPRVLPQDRHGGGRQLRDVPMQSPVAGANPDVRAAQAMQAARPGASQAMPSAAPQANDGRFGQHGDQRMNGQRNNAQGPGQAPVAPVAGMPQAPMPPQAHGHDRMQAPPLARAPAPVAVPAPAGAPRDQQNAPDGQRGRTRPEQTGPQSAPVQQRTDPQAAAAQQRNQQQAEAQQRRIQQATAEQQKSQQHAAEQLRVQQAAAAQQHNQQHAAEQQRVQQAAAAQQHNQQQAAEQLRVQQAAAAQQRNQQQAAEQQRVQQQAAAEQRRSERQQRHEAPAAQPAPPPPPAAQPAPKAQAPQHGRGNEEKKDEKRNRDHPEQN